MELDIYIPSLNLAFEYQVFMLLSPFPIPDSHCPYQQEQHHYASVNFVYQPLEEVQERDKTKQQLVAEKGITLITVPYWWDCQKERYRRNYTIAFVQD